MEPVHTNQLPRVEIRSDEDETINWGGAFAAYGGQGADQSSVVVFEIAPQGHLGWHTDQTEESQYIISGTGILKVDDREYPVHSGTVFVVPTNVRHDLVNTGDEPLRAVAFFAAAMFTQKFDNVLQPAGSRVVGTPNRNG